MAKLPGIRYGMAVPSTGRQDPMQPVRVAGAQAQAARAVGSAITDLTDMYVVIQEEEGRNSAAEAASEFVKAEAEIRTNPNIAERESQMVDLRESVGDNYSTNLDRYGRKEFDKNFKDWSQGHVDQVIIDGVEENYNKQRTITQNLSLELAAQGELTEALAFIEGSTLLNDIEKTALSKRAKLDFELSEIDRTIAGRNPDDISQLLSEIDDDDYSGSLKPTQRRAAVTQLKAAFELSVAEFEAGQAKSTQLEASNLELAVRNGFSGPTQIHQAWEDDIITGPKRTQLMVIWQDAQDAALTRTHNIELVDTSIIDGTPLDRTNTDHTDAVDAWYEDIQDRYADDPTMIATLGVNVAAHTNILPEQMEADLRRMAFAGSDENVMATANVYESLEVNAPQVLADIGAREVAVYKQVTAFHRGGASLEDSVERARKNAYKPAAEMAILNQRYTIEVAPDIITAKDSLQSWLAKDDQFDVSYGWGGAPEVSNAAFSAYRSSEMAYFQLTDGDVQMARQLARDDFKRVFSTSRINNRDEIMPYSPEREYGMELGSDVLKRDLKMYYKDESLDNSAFILADAVTARDPVGGRTYAVYTLDEYGLPNKHDSRWKPNAERMKAVHDAEVAEAVKLSKAKDVKVEELIKLKLLETGRM